LRALFGQPHGEKPDKQARGHFPTDEVAMKLPFLVLNRSKKDWFMPPVSGPWPRLNYTAERMS
jgi:transposase-like protein